MVSVGRQRVGLEKEPSGVRRQPVLGREDHAAELSRGDPDALLADQRAHRMKRQQTGNDLLRHLDARLRFSDPRVGVVGLRPWQRKGIVDLPAQRRPKRRVLREEVEQDGCARARLAHDEDRPADRIGCDVGILFAPLRDLQPAHQWPHNVPHRDLDAQGVTAGPRTPGRRTACPIRPASPRAHRSRRCPPFRTPARRAGPAGSARRSRNRLGA